MYCDRCGQALVSDAQFCSACGRRFGDAAVVALAPASSLSKHVQTLGVLWFARGVLRLIQAVWLVAVGRYLLPSIMNIVGPYIPFLAGGLPLGRLLWSSTLFGAAFGIVFAVAEFIAAWGLLERQPWARILAIILGFLALLSPILGTALGIYTLVILLPANAAAEYDRFARHA